ncbi:MAG: S-methyl-5-thioribose-1-phosphate isomerase [Dehalococcoidales bacterium]|jgi:methylthioribose-1-phosphate isomerase|nr:S-methyl-5-thioribose-1-phosphate isomerase [Dehalococcoidales bacterium]MDD3264853.1 S-methyl-5-thioribose-1-phosphate isomerase [Dehalococcoidales bacterium]MDD4322035.1 S-methyl-5-thioribose-1-phosphate isomerase [Dehalococcoidales bacterium]MDD4794412.1 S-methyl-5-thioribose-1-phosphate isomerase [Dehalococcoidales bacterium]MDD5122720.1 S-methyl-5-thioribose-1-phosphate isomerase [Dehalococcoidales bacterium]
MQPLIFENNVLNILDQTKLPGEAIYLKTTDYTDVCQAIRELSVRGAPAIGVAAGYAIALGARSINAADMPAFLTELESVITTVTSTRPTAQNLFQAAERMKKVALLCQTSGEAREKLLQEARNIHFEQIKTDLEIGRLGAAIVKDKTSILTHCNTGSLATAGYGTALGVIKYAYSLGKKISVIATETRPLLQGARLTAFELKTEGIPFVLITDSMAGYIMSLGKVDMVITGADRIALNGDTANKIGTYTLAILAREHGVPFYIAAPTTTFDIKTQSGQDIVIEEREPEEVTHFNCHPSAPQGTKALNPAFDVTPSNLVSGYITEKGVFKAKEIASIFSDL